MSNVSQENIGLNHEKITIFLSKDDYMPAVEKALKQYAKNATIPGFRKGMVPLGMVKKMYGHSIYSDEVLRQAGTILENYLQETKAEIFGRPIQTITQKQYRFDMNNPEEFEFEFEIGTKPNFDIPLFTNNEAIDNYKIKVSEAMLQEEMEKLQYKSGNMTDPEFVSGEDNVLNVVFEEIDEQGTVVENGIKKDNSLLVKYFTPAMQSQLMGKKNNDSIEFSLRDSFDEKLLPAIMKDLDLSPTDDSAKDKRFSMLIVKVGLVEKMEIGPEMFEKNYPNRGIETTEEFRNVLENEIQHYWNSESRTRLHNELFEKLVHETPIQLPMQFLKRFMSVGGEKYASPEEVEAEYDGFEHQLRWQLVSDKIIHDNQLAVTNEEMEQATRMQIMSYFGQYGGASLDMNAEWTDKLVSKQLADKKFSGDVYNKIITDKLFYQIEQQINLLEKEITLEEFAQLPSSRHHHHTH